MVIPDVMYYAQRVKLQELMQTTGLPVAYGLREAVTAGGGLLSYTTKLPAAGSGFARSTFEPVVGAAECCDA